MNINQHDWWVKVNCNHLLTCPVVFFLFSTIQNVHAEQSTLPRSVWKTKTQSHYIYITQSALGAVCWEMVCIFGATHYILAVTPITAKGPSDHLRSTNPAKSLALCSWITFSFKHMYDHVYLCNSYIYLSHSCNTQFAAANRSPCMEYGCPLSGHPCWKWNRCDHKPHGHWLYSMCIYI